VEPVGYLQIVRRWWWLIAGLVIAALVIVYAVTPARLVDHYQATHVLLVENDGDGEGSRNSVSNPEVVALWAKESEVLDRAAQAIGPAVDPERLGRDIDVDTNRNVGTVSITATDLDPERAALKANTVAEQTIAFLVEREQARRDQTAAELAEQEESLNVRIAELDDEIAQNPGNIETITAERDALIRQLGDVLEAQDADDVAVVYTSLDEPERGTKEDRLPGTGSRLERMALAAGVALLLGFGLALTLDRSDSRIRNRRRAEESFGLPVIADVVKFPIWTRRRRLAVLQQPDTAVAESYRTLRSALMLLESPGPAVRREATAHASNGNGDQVPLGGEIIMITSGGSGEGKTTTVANLAAAYGESGCSVLVLSFDLQRRRRRNRARLGRGPGITEYFAADPPIPLADLVVPTRVPGVSRVGVGTAARPPGGQFETQLRLLDEARGLADVIIVDSAPLLASSVNRELATMVDRVVALCRVGRTTTAQAEQCGDLLAQLGAPAIGVVMVGVTAPEGSEYFAYFTRRRELRGAAATGAPTAEQPPAAAATGASAPAATGNGDVHHATPRDVPVDDR
jgi:Mrp family chromosome partitioning ATPase/capsular polysaccharide biosynthesis protein